MRHPISARNANKRPLLAATAMALFLAACGSGQTDGTASPADTEPSPTGTQAATQPAAASCPDGASAEWQWTTLTVPGSATNDGVDWFAEQVAERTDGRVTINMNYGGALLGAQEEVSGIASGRADGGAITAQYYPGDLPLTQIAFVPGIASNPAARMYAFTDLQEVNEAYAAEWEDAGLRLLANVPIGSYGVGTTDPVSGLDDLEGKRVRAVGHMATVFESIGASPVPTGGGEIYESLERGVLDAWSGQSLDVAAAASLNEVAPHLLATQNFGGAGHFAIVAGQHAWEGLCEADQVAIRDLAEEYQERAVEQLIAAEDEACTTFLESGGSATMLTEDEEEEWAAAVGDSIIEQWRTDAVDSGLSEEQVTEFEEDFTEMTTQAAADSEYVNAFVRCAQQDS